jgi:hypothetical protein
MFFVRAAFWIFIIILLLPSNGREKFEFYSSVERTVADIGGFCTRNPEVCDQVASMFTGVVDKLRNSAEMIEEALRDAGIGTRRDHMSHGPAGEERHGRLSDDPNVTAASSLSADTLTTDDLRPIWHGPDRI